MRIELTVCGPDGVDHDVAMVATARATFGEIRGALGAAFGTPFAAAPWWSGSRRLSDDDRLGGPGLRSGDRLSRTRGEQFDRRVIEVVGGIDAGRTVRGAGRSVVVGRASDCDLTLHDPLVSRRHAQVTIGASGAVVCDLGSAHGTGLAEQPITTSVAWPSTQWVRVGDTHLAQARGPEQPAAVTPAGDGSLVVRPRRRTEAPGAAVIDAATPDRPAVRAALGWTALLVPAVSGAGLALWTGSVLVLAITLLVPLVLVLGALVHRARGRRDHRRVRAASAAAARRAAAELDTALTAETDRRRRLHPDAPTIEAIARSRSRRLWERAPDDPGVLYVRIGLADEPSRTQLRSGGQCTPAALLQAVPAVLDLMAGPVGLVGPPQSVHALARWLVVQLAVLVSPADLDLDIRVDDVGWRWARWLPHTRRTGRAAVSVVVASAADCGELGPAALCLAQRRADLPAECSRVVLTVNEAGTRVAVDGHPVLADAVDAQFAERVARALAPLVPGADDDAGFVPPAGRLSDLLEPPEPASIRRRWADTHGTSVPIGLGVDGVESLDLGRDGPHLLIAGTTGAGKSELLRTLIVALACTYPPDELTFVLVDYKGGAAFAECARLPHVTGLVTDLDEQLTARALASLGAEIRRRERLLADADVPDLETYRRVGAAPTLPRLMVVIDEYATLASELPDFVTGLTGIAQRGRSLGLHLVLATQRPAGVVTAAVRANCSLRIALRVTDPADSQDVIDGPQAASIPNELPGRAYVRTGATTRPVQIARTDLPYRRPGQVVVAPLDRGGPAKVEHLETGDTELAEFVRAAGQAAEGRRPAAPPWAPQLPADLALDSIPVPPTREAIAIGLVDLPELQAQKPLALDLTAGGCILVAGAGRTGRTSTLAVAAIAAARRHPPSELHIHLIDLVGELARALADLPQLGTSVTQAEGIEVADALLDELTTRPAPRTILMVDGWDTFVRAGEACDGGACVDKLLALAAAGTRGRTIMIAGGRSVLSPRLSGAATTRILFRMPDRTDHLLAGVALSAVPTRMPPGRVVLAPDGVLAHVATIDPAGAVAECSARWPGARCAPRLGSLPDRVDLAGLAATADAAAFAVRAPFGEPVCLPLCNGTRLLVLGPARSGRSAALSTVLHQACAAGIPVVVAAGPRSPVRAEAGRFGVAAIDPGDTPVADQLSGAVLLVDDAEDFADTAAGETLTAAAASAPAVIVATRHDEAARAYRGVVASVRRSRCALLLQPGPLDGEIVGVRLPRTMLGGPAGRGVLVGDPAWVAGVAGPARVQVAILA